MRKRLFIIIAIVLIGFVVIEKNIQTTNNIKIYVSIQQTPYFPL